jgi:hypothetical protein
MKSIVALLALAVLMVARADAAGLSLTWDRCATNPGATTNTTFDCSDPSAIHTLYAVFSSPVAANVLALEFSIDFQVDAPALPTFWQINTPITPTACNDGVLFARIRSATTCSAKQIWQAGGAAVMNPQVGFAPYGGPNRGRIVGSVWTTTPIAIAANENCHGFHINFLPSVATEAGGSCAGCQTPAAIVWNSATIGELAHGGVVPEDVPITGAGIVGNCATVNGATSVCAATPARNRTWGALKSLYR